jgi:flagellar hook-basal body complex protein FliE
MKVDLIQQVNNTSGLSDMMRRETIPQALPPAKENFAGLLKSMVEDVNEIQHDAAELETRFLKGEISDVHQVMIATEEASVSFKLLMEIRNKLLESYREIMRMHA